MLDIAPEKVAHVIIKAREFDSKVATLNLNEGSGSDGEPSDALEDLPGDLTRAELVGFITALNEDEQANLVALTWIGRGTFEPDELDEAVEMARQEHVNATAQYLLGIPLLANYLEDGLDKLGYPVDAIEGDLL